MNNIQFTKIESKCYFSLVSNYPVSQYVTVQCVLLLNVVNLSEHYRHSKM